MGLFAVAEQRRRDERAAADAARRRRGDARHVHELGERPLDRRLLHAHDRRARGRPAAHAAERARRARRLRGRRDAHLAPAARGDAVRAFLGYNPIADAARPARAARRCPPAQAQTLTGRSFFPHLISSPFHTALVYAFVFAIAACLVAAVASLLRGGKYVHVEASRGGSARRRGRGVSVDDALRIGEVAEQVGVTPRTIRYYEELGLLGSGSRAREGRRTARTRRRTSAGCRS